MNPHNIDILPVAVPAMLPITGNLDEFPVGRSTVGRELAARIGTLPPGRSLAIRADFWPSAETIELWRTSQENILIHEQSDQAGVAQLAVEGADKTISLEAEKAGKLLRYPWDLLALNEELLAAVDADCVAGTVRERVTLDGKLILDENSVILPGVYIEGVAVIGRDCKIGPNAYLRGFNRIGDRCHIGQAVEIKNSILGEKVSAGHLTYIGDSIVCRHVNFGAGTIISNFRHDGKNHRSLVNNVLVDTGRRKFGSVIGENVHTGIHTSIYPGRKLYANVATLPGEIISTDKVC